MMRREFWPRRARWGYPFSGYYGMAVASGAHKVSRAFNDICETKRGVDVKFGIHPVAGAHARHMNVPSCRGLHSVHKLLDTGISTGSFSADRRGKLSSGANDVTIPQLSAHHNKQPELWNADLDV